MTSRLVASSLLLLLTACPPGPTTPDGGDPGSGGGTGGGGGMAVGADGGMLSAPVLTSATAQVSGRTGKDLRVGIVGKDRDLDLVGAAVQLVDSSGQVVTGPDLDNDGTADPVQYTVSFDSKRWVGETLTASGSVRAVFEAQASISQVVVRLIDAASLSSASLTVALTEQPIKMLGDACDPTFVSSRCATSYGCRGMPATCQEGLAPTILKMGFFRDPAGPNILLEGTEPEDDLATVRLRFQNAQGTFISVDSDGDNVPDLSEFTANVAGAAVDGTFFVRLQGSVGLDSQVPMLVATAIDAAGHESAIKKAAPSTPPVRSAGQSCDPRGFDVCGANLACSPGIVGATNKCTSLTTLTTNACRTAPVLIPTAQGASVIGVAVGSGLYDAPTGCSSNDPKGRPDSVVIVRLATRANTLTLTTARPATNFDTTMYVLTGCPTNSSQALDCSDDSQGGGASTITLTDLPAGDYLVVVDSFSPAGGTFELLATVN